MIVVIEGIDGCGKTNVVEILSEKLARLLPHDMTVARMAFPNRESPTGRIIDGYLRDPEQFRGMDAYAHQALQIVNRLEVLPELQRADRVNVLSRYTPSAFVYGMLDDLPRAWLDRVTAALPSPDLCVLLDVPAELAYERMRSRGVTADQYEQRGVDWFKRAADLYGNLWSEESREIGSPTTWMRVSAVTGTLCNLTDVIVRAFMGMFACPCGKIHGQMTPCQQNEEAGDGEEE